MRATTLPPLEPDAWTDRRVVVAVAHPDDEVLGCGGLLPALRDVLVVQVTDGAPRRGDHAAQAGFASAGDYAAARRAESLAALALAGIAPARLTNLGYADQDAPGDLVAIARALAPLIAGAAIVLTHAYEGGHGDHDAVAFAVQAAARLCPPASRPRIVEMPYYHAADEGWVRQRFLPGAAAVTRPLSPSERALKARMIAAHASQAATLGAFALDLERFRHAPPHDFTVRPHDGPLLYERHGWNLTWPAWQARVRDAVATLGVACAG